MPDVVPLLRGLSPVPFTCPGPTPSHPLHPCPPNPGSKLTSLTNAAGTVALSVSKTAAQLSLASTATKAVLWSPPFAKAGTGAGSLCLLSDGSVSVTDSRGDQQCCTERVVDAWAGSLIACWSCLAAICHRCRHAPASDGIMSSRAGKRQCTVAVACCRSNLQWQPHLLPANSTCISQAAPCSSPSMACPRPSTSGRPSGWPSVWTAT
jgi:hypothetical protein